jgi:hypothetical protein
MPVGGHGLLHLGLLRRCLCGPPPGVLSFTGWGGRARPLADLSGSEAVGSPDLSPDPLSAEADPLRKWSWRVGN